METEVLRRAEAKNYLYVRVVMIKMFSCIY